MNDIENEIKKIKYQLSVIAECIDYEKNPIPSLILYLDWGDDELNKAHDIFEIFENKLEKNEDISWGEFEGMFQKELNIGYQRLKSIVLSFYRNHQWISVCIAYAKAKECMEFHIITKNN